MPDDETPIPLAAKLSFIFLVIALTAVIPIWNSLANPKDGFSGASQGWMNLLWIAFISLPSTVLSFILGLVSVGRCKLAYISLIPSGLFLFVILVQLGSN